MDLKLSNLIEIVYDNNINDKEKENIIELINSLKIDNLLNINKKKIQKFFLVVSHESNNIDFKLNPYFELIDLENEIENNEDNDYTIINEGLDPNYHDNFHTNININLLEDNKINNFISIKKLLKSLKYPENLLDGIYEDSDNEDIEEYNSEHQNIDELLSNLENYQNLSEQILQQTIHNITNLNNENIINQNQTINEEDEDENEIDILTQTIDNIEDNNEDEDEEDEEDEEYEEYDIIEVKLKRKTLLDSFDFKIYLNEENKIVVNDVKKHGLSFNKLLSGDIIRKINNIDINNFEVKKIIKLIAFNLNVKFTILRKKNKKININNQSFYRIIGDKYIKISLFKKMYNFKTKKFDKEKIKYITTLFLSDFLTYPKVLDLEQSKIESYLKDNDVFSKSYFENYFIDYGELPYIDNIFDNIESLSNGFFSYLKKIKSGVYLNKNCILWNIYLVCNMICDGVNVYEFDYSKYSLKNIKQLYFPYYVKSKASIFEKMLIKSMVISCDRCNEIICRNTTHKFYSSPIYGDLCKKCYEKKKDIYNKRILYLKKMMLLQGKKIIFQKELKKTKEYLNNKKLKPLKKNNYVKLLENINTTVITKSNRKTCNICFDNIDINSKLGTFSDCGHVFHYNCIKKIDNDQCPICRRYSKFIKLFV